MPPRKRTSTSQLDAAVAAAGRKDWAACLSALLATWRAARSPKLAELVERVSAKVPAAAIGGSGSATKQVRARIASITDADVAVILEYALRQIRTFPAAYEWVVELANASDPDPRIATALVAIVDKPAYRDLQANDEGALQKDVIAALDAIDDPRYRKRIVDDWRRLEGWRSRIRKYRGALDALAAIASAIEKRTAPAEPAGLAAAIAKIDAALRETSPKQTKKKRDAGDLLAAIYADPASTELRLVYADALQEAGDPRGELIALQCGRAVDAAPTARERALVKTHGRTWLGPLEPIILKQGVVYRRGFLGCAREGHKKIAARPLFASPMWATVEELEVSVWGEHAVKFLADKRWKALRRVFGVYHEDLPALADAGVRVAWTALGVRYPNSATWETVASLCPHVTEIDLADGDQGIPQLPIIAKYCGKRVQRVRVAAARGEIAKLARAAANAYGFELELVPQYSFPGAPEGEAVRLVGNRATLVFHDAVLDARYAALVLGALPAKTIEEIELACRPKVRITDAPWTALAAAAKRHGVTITRPA